MQKKNKPVRRHKNSIAKIEEKPNNKCVEQKQFKKKNKMLIIQNQKIKTMIKSRKKTIKANEKEI